MAFFAEYGRGHKRIKAPGLLSRFYMMHPLVLLLYYISALFFVLSYSNPVFVITVCVFMFLTGIYFAGAKKTFKTLQMAMYIGLLIFLINPIINHRGSHIIFYLFDNPITLEATFFGFFNMIMIMSMLLLFVSFNILLNSQRFLYLFSWALPQITFIVNMSLRYVSLFIKRGKELFSVLSLRGINIKSGKKTEIIKNAGKILSALTEWSLEDGMCIAQSLKVKGYKTSKRTCYQSFTFALRDKVLTCIFSILIIMSCWLNFFGGGSFSFYPRLNLIVFNFNDILAYVIMVISLSMPFIVEGIYRLIYKIRVKRTVINFGIAQKHY